MTLAEPDRAVQPPTRPRAEPDPGAAYLRPLQQRDPREYRRRLRRGISGAEAAGCHVLHETARLERELYGAVVSESVADHVGRHLPDPGFRILR